MQLWTGCQFDCEKKEIDDITEDNPELFVWWCKDLFVDSVSGEDSRRISLRGGGPPHGVMVKVMDSRVLVSESEL